MNDKPKVKATPEVRKRVWEHALHEEKIYNERGNFFLVSEAMLFVFFATLGTDTQTWALYLISALGLCLTLMWVIIAIRQGADLDLAKKRVCWYCDEYEEFKMEREQSEENGRSRDFRAYDKLILGKIIPTILGLAWVILIVEIWTKDICA